EVGHQHIISGTGNLESIFKYVRKQQCRIAVNFWHFYTVRLQKLARHGTAHGMNVQVLSSKIFFRNLSVPTGTPDVISGSGVMENGADRQQPRLVSHLIITTESMLRKDLTGND